eukprot:COSAG02_NODE_27286_length_613_cov_0.789883_1_plen_39_part_10
MYSVTKLASMSTTDFCASYIIMHSIVLRTLTTDQPRCSK